MLHSPLTPISPACVLRQNAFAMAGMLLLIAQLVAQSNMPEAQVTQELKVIGFKYMNAGCAAGFSLRLCSAVAPRRPMAAVIMAYCVLCVAGGVPALAGRCLPGCRDSDLLSRARAAFSSQDVHAHGVRASAYAGDVARDGGGVVPAVRGGPFHGWTKRGCDNEGTPSPKPQMQPPVCLSRDPDGIALMRGYLADCLV